MDTAPAVPAELRLAHPEEAAVALQTLPLPATVSRKPGKMFPADSPPLHSKGKSQSKDYSRNKPHSIPVCVIEKHGRFVSYRRTVDAIDNTQTGGLAPTTSITGKLPPRLERCLIRICANQRQKSSGIQS
jgi:hypothetical protein